MTDEENLDSNKEAKEFAFVVPTDVYFEENVSGLSDEMLQRYHDVLHVLWRKLFEGFAEFGEFKWTFNKVIFKHSEVVKEMWNRKIYHYEPFDSLDKIKYYSKDSEYSSSELSKKEEEKKDISFEPSSINRINKQ